jgi:hypothetical protein
MAPMDQTAHNLQQQIDLYGEPLGETVRRVVGPLGLTQGGLAQVIGLSAPMLSQLVSAQRVKIGNPAVVSRLRAASQLADLAVAGEVDPDDLPDALDRIRATTAVLTTSTPATHPPRASAGPATPFATPPGLPDHQGSAGTGGGVTPAWTAGSAGWAAGPPGWADEGASGVPAARSVVRAIQDLFREVASTDEIQQAAAAIAPDSPAVAELLLVYGTGRTADALAHYEMHHG